MNKLKICQDKEQNNCKINTPVVIMAGGKGTRLYPYTKILPKPLIPIDDVPIAERIINRFHKYGCCNFYMTLNYNKQIIQAYFDSMLKNYNINYIIEEKPLGTGGSLFLLKDLINQTFFVSNCDILINDNYIDMLKYHRDNNNKITVISAFKNLSVPYGVMKIDKNNLIYKIEEKPKYDFLVNTGMYIFEPEVLEYIPKDEFFHITDLIRIYIDMGERVGLYEVSEDSWLDMGQFDEMNRMIKELKQGER